MANVQTLQNSRLTRAVGALVVGAAVSLAAAYVRKKILKAMKFRESEERLDRDLAASMDCSDSVSRY